MDTAGLAKAAKAGDVAAFTELVQRYGTMAFGYAWATTRDFDLAEDAAQQAFITAWGALDRLEHPERFGGWLRGIVRFECLHLLRSRTRHAQSLPLDLAAGIAATDPSPVDLAEANDALDGILAAFGALPDAERMAAVLYYVRDHRQREVAAFLGLTVSTVNNRLRSARKRLRQEGLAHMAPHAFRHHPLPDDFAARIGAVVRSHGSVIDARFPAGQRPPILNAVTVADDASGRVAMAQVAQYLDDDLVRCFTLDDVRQRDDRFAPGAAIRDLGRTVSTPLTTAALLEIVGRIGANPAGPNVQWTGIKAIDIFCPIPEGGTIGLVGDMQTGKMVLVEELIHRLRDLARPLSVMVFVEATAETHAIQQLEYRTSGSVAAIYLPVADASPEALAPILDRFDAVITFSRALGKERFYPAIDPLRSHSRLLDPAVVGIDHERVARQAESALRDAASPALAARLRRYLTQPFHVAEAFTERAGVSVSRNEAVADLRSLLDGDYADDADDALFMIGAIGAADRDDRA